MSLHARLSSEAISVLHAQRRNSTICSIIASILFLVLLGLLLALILHQSVVEEKTVIVTYNAVSEAEVELEKKKFTRQVQPKPNSPPSSMARVIASATPSSTAIPVPDLVITNQPSDFGNGEDFGEGWGDGGWGGGGGFGGIPSAMRDRCSLDQRLKRLEENGGNKKCEDAVVKALQWLKANQEEDGSWSHKAGTDQYRAAMTGFAVLAFLGHCESPNSPEFGEAVSAGIIFLIDVGMKNDGKLTTAGAGGHWVYEHAIATYALAEAYTFCLGLDINIPNLDKVTKKAGDIVMEGQSESGSWVYSYGKSGGDNSVGYWQLQAIKAYHLTGLRQEESAFKKVFSKAKEWFEKVQGSNGTFGYRADPAKNPGLTGGGVLCLQMMGLRDSKAVKAGIDYVTTSIKDQKFKLAQLYYHYYNAQAMINHGGSEWKKYNKFFRDDLLDLQNKDGSWPASGGHGSINPVMATCLSTFMLEVYYRFLPATGANME
ncbi:MAG: terpene cyclase/mutase family protein [Akkermansiaceae bacterium]